MNNFNFQQQGGFPLTTLILHELQKAYSIFNAFGGIIGDLTIISGCVTTGSNVSNGAVFINGELIEFKGGLAQTNVIIKEEISYLIFKNGQSNSVIKTRYATFGTSIDESYPWANFVRPMLTKDIASALSGKVEASLFNTLSALVQGMVTKLNGIEAGAQKNVQADWDEANNTSPAFIKNKKNFLEYLRKGTYNIGNPGSFNTYQVDFPPLPNNNYMVIPSLVSYGTPSSDLTVEYQIREKANNYFKIIMKENGNFTQDLKMDWILIPL